MGTITLQIPQSGQANSTEDVKVSNDFTTLQTLVNGNLDTNNLSPTAGILASQCAFPVLSSAGTVYMPRIAGASGQQSVSADNQLYVEQVSIFGASLMGITVLNASGSNGSIRVALFNAGGSQVAVSSSAAQVSSGSGAFQRIPFISTYSASAGVYYIGVQYSSHFATFTGSQVAAPSASLAQGSFTMPGSITAPSTLTNSQLPIVATY